MKIWNKIKEFITKAGFAKIGFLGGSVAAFLLGLHDVGVGFGAIFAYINANQFQKLIRGIKL